MSITEPWHRTEGPKSHRCFFCGLGMTDPGLHWQGFTDAERIEPLHLFLHPGCFLDLTIQLNRDVCEISSRYGYRARLSSASSS